MTKLEKVVKGLECCIKRDPDDYLRCDECPYPDGSACANRLKIDALELLKAQQPTVDAELVIRCKDCRYGTLHCDYLGIRSVSCNHPSNFFKPWYLRPDFYCADGERREKE